MKKKSNAKRPRAAAPPPASPGPTDDFAPMTIQTDYFVEEAHHYIDELAKRVRELEAEIEDWRHQDDEVSGQIEYWKARAAELESIVLGLRKPALNPKVGIVAAREREASS